MPIIIALCALLTGGTLFAQSAQVQQDFIQGPEAKHIEFFVAKPAGKGPFPVMFLLHGYQPPDSSDGGKQLVGYRYLDRFVNLGIVAVSISVPGYGLSDGPRDYCGPSSQDAIKTVIEHFKNLPFIDAARMGIYGISRGATLASMVSVDYPSLTLQILEAGIYDLVSDRELPSYLQGINNGLLLEGGNTPEQRALRSAVAHAHQVTAATCILHGEFDDRRGLASAISLCNQLQQHGVESRLVIFKNATHDLSKTNKWETITPFVRERLLNLYGVGIELSEAIPAIQVTQIHPHSSALGKLRLGDVILKISPHNDAQEIEVLGLKCSDLAGLILGPQGTLLRMQVLHFDLSLEEIVLERKAS